eukprot:s332_g47.t1
MFSRILLLSICVLVDAARLEDESDLFDIASAGADDSRDIIDFEHSDLSNYETSNFIAMGEETSEEAPKSRRKNRRGRRGRGGKSGQGPSKSGGPSGEEVSADEMQLGLLEFLKQHRDAGGLPEFQKPPDEYKDLLANAGEESRSLCFKELGGLLNKLVKRCIGIFDTRSTSKPDTRRNCARSVYSIFLQGKRVVQAQPLPRDLAMDHPQTKPLVELGHFQKTWIVELATAKKAAILWAGFWTNASDPDGHQSRTSKESLFDFADRIETQTVHPSTELGQLAEKYDNLADCKGPVENEVKGNMWSLFSFAFVYGMKEKRQDTVVALVHKAMDGDRPLDQSVLFQYEVPTIGIAAWGLGFWSPQVVLIDLMGTCKQTSPALRKQLYSGLPRLYELFVKEFEWSASDFKWRSRLSWTCLDCPNSHCQLDKHLAKQVKGILQAKRQQDQKGVDLIRAAKAGKVSEVEKLLNDGADVNFQDQIRHGLGMDSQTLFSLSLHFPIFHSESRAIVMLLSCHRHVHVAVGKLVLYALQDKEGDTPLSLAVQKGHTAAAQLLLDHDAYVDARNSWGRTPLFGAGTRELQKLLLEHGANRNARSLSRETLHLRI